MYTPDDIYGTGTIISQGRTTITFFYAFQQHRYQVFLLAVCRDYWPLPCMLCAIRRPTRKLVYTIKCLLPTNIKHWTCIINTYSVYHITWLQTKSHTIRTLSRSHENVNSLKLSYISRFAHDTVHIYSSLLLVHISLNIHVNRTPKLQSSPPQEVKTYYTTHVKCMYIHVYLIWYEHRHQAHLSIPLESSQ